MRMSTSRRRRSSRSRGRVPRGRAPTAAAAPAAADEAESRRSWRGLRELEELNGETSTPVGPVAGRSFACLHGSTAARLPSSRSVASAPVSHHRYAPATMSKFPSREERSKKARRSTNMAGGAFEEGETFYEHERERQHRDDHDPSRRWWHACLSARPSGADTENK
jgi:hypothetical protein